jgi:hypothetical protein
MQPRLIAKLTAIVLTAMLAACGGGRGSSKVIQHPTGDALVLRVEVRGGFVGPDAQLGQLPGFTLLGDGRVIQTGAVMAIFPGPLMPPLTVRRLNESGVQAVLREVAATGLFTVDRRFDGANAHVADAPDTIFELHADGVDVTISVYALGIAGNELPDDQARAYAKLSNLNDRLASLEAWLPDSAWADARSAPFSADALRLLVRDASAEQPDPSGIGFSLVPWPTEADPTAGEAFRDWHCSVVSGDAAKVWNAQLTKANTLTRWTQGDARYQVLPLPLLPDQATECPRS